ncbi:hypothetical protein [Paraburkholderia caribensis]|uniref:hypothetical protein n=1 Tax=Paraburkholderia caribensis TaxID=75105 RepID=UPI001CAF9177|nr:hypothetical protein [Paraburkholderia caribensis]CAG9249978.1 conserved hypothetical protein [Paraburkholderia caribensis]
MADESMERFLLEYNVALRGSTERLSKLEQAMKGPSESANNSFNSLKSFAADASGELGKLVPGMQAISNAIKSLGVEFGVATVALTAIAFGVKASINARDQYNAQRAAGMSLGVSSTRLEEYQRKWAKRSGGNVSREGALEGLQRFAEMSRAAYMDPSRLGREARLMKVLGVNVGERGAASPGFNDQLGQLARGLQGKSAGDVQGIALASGMSQDWLLTLQKLGPSVGKITELTSEEITKREAAEQSVAKRNEELAQLKERWTEASNALAEPLLPALTKLVEFVAETLKFMFPTDPAKQKKLRVLEEIAPSNPIMNMIDSAISLFSGKKSEHGGNLGTDLKALLRGKGREDDAATDARDAAVARLDEVNKTSQQKANLEAAAINMFAGAVQSFSSAINLQQAWAAWAGAALSPLTASDTQPSPSTNTGTARIGSSVSRGIQNNNPGNLEYGQFTKSNGATGSDGRFAVFPTMQQGIDAHEKLLRTAYISKGFDTPSKIIAKYAPAVENNHSAYLKYLATRGFGANTPINDSNVGAFAAAQRVFETGFRGFSGHGTAPGITAKLDTLKSQLSKPIVPAHRVFQRINTLSNGVDKMREFVKGSKTSAAQSSVSLKDLPPLILNIDARGKTPKAIGVEVHKQVQRALAGAIN